MFKRIKSFRNKKPVLSMIFGYAIIWIICCLVLTRIIGKDKFELYAKDYQSKVDVDIRQTLEELKEKALSPEFDLEKDKTMLEYTMQKMLADVSYRTEGKVYGVCDLMVYDSTKVTTFYRIPEENKYLSMTTAGNNKAYYITENKNGKVLYLSCPVQYFENIIRETYNIKGKVANRWERSLVDTWYIQVVEDYRTEEEFRPLTVEISYWDNYEDESIGSSRYRWSDRKIIDCDVKELPEGAEKHFNDKYYPIPLDNGVVFSGDVNYWEDISEDELGKWASELYNEQFANLYYLYYRNYISDYLISESDALLVERRLLGNKEYKGWETESSGVDGWSWSKKSVSGIKAPFAFLNGDVIYIYKDSIKGLNGQYINVLLTAVIKGCLGSKRLEFFKSMIWIYLGTFVFFALLVWYAYKRFYSLQGKNRFHKSLINSMAHDLKTPLMIMQGFSENLKENVHTEKRDYYADEILKNVKYLNTLIDKNLNFSRKKDFETLEEKSVYLSELITKTVKRYDEKLKEKNLIVTVNGNSHLKGDPEILGLAIDNLINNAIKYTMEGETIGILASDRAFSVINKAELHYNKNLQHLLDPLEMGDESRTTGSGTGLGLSIANGIVQERGWRMKLAYNKKTKEFICMVKLKRWLW